MMRPRLPVESSSLLSMVSIIFPFISFMTRSTCRSKSFLFSSMAFLIVPYMPRYWSSIACSIWRVKLSFAFLISISMPLLTLFSVSAIFWSTYWAASSLAFLIASPTYLLIWVSAYLISESKVFIRLRSWSTKACSTFLILRPKDSSNSRRI